MKATLARISFQRFFRQYPKLAGMTGTAWEARHEFWQVYHRQVVPIPTHRKCIRKTEPDRFFRTAQAKWSAVVQQIEQWHKAGRPVLIGTRHIADSDRLSELLNERQLSHQVLNAVRHEAESKIVTEAGQPGAITVATNMAGRGTDIKLGAAVAELGGLAVIAADRNESPRIDRQLFGRCARQGDSGSSLVFVSVEDGLFRRYATAGQRHWASLFASGRTAVHCWMGRCIVTRVQRKAERQALNQRKRVLRHDDWLDEQLGFAGSER